MAESRWKKKGPRARRDFSAPHWFGITPTAATRVPGGAGSGILARRRRES